ncbi:MAG: TylF/MycF/NovP-related O-methyltransferase [Ardenticatenia bacterium]|nr:TylF/MycF/NovP-related O-methyltransferase [Ardenticatenia bacterium]
MIQRPLFVPPVSTLTKLARLGLQNWKTLQTIVRIKRERLTFLSTLALLDLYNTVRELEHHNVQGIFIEAGCALGGSALVIATAKSRKRPFLIFDTFEMIPPPSHKDGIDAHERYQEIVRGHARGPGDTVYYGYKPNLLTEVRERFVHFGLEPASHNITFIPGLFQDTMNLHQPIAFAHVDSDWYESVKTCLERIVPFMHPQGVLVVDDYDQWSGCRRAVDEFFEGRSGFVFQMKSQLFIRRVRQDLFC